MSSLGKVTGSVVSGHNENTLALANVNFNFALYRVDAPPAFHGLGSSLSATRRKDAEEGQSHQTARKLGALFEHVVEIRKDLLQQYGKRVSEISMMDSVNPKGSQQHGFFKEQVGADGTAIWAAATSGSSAIAANMLACMLAVLFTPPEATSIWAELVAVRKQEIRQVCDGTEASHFGLIEASKQDISRKELADWDAKARAWLARANEAKRREQIKLKLILDNLNIAVDGSKNVYTSVIRSWKSAMQMMDNLLHGVPQSVSTGAILLALSAWHMYPDLIIFGQQVKVVEFKDTAFNSGTKLTIGLENAEQEQSDGVYWSLSLGHLQYYGDEELISRSARKDASKLNFTDLALATLGSFCASNIQSDGDIELAAKILVDMHTRLSRSKTNQAMGDPSSWFSLLSEAARRLLHAEDLEKNRDRMLFKTGVRHGANFLGKEKVIDSTFGSRDISHFVRLLADPEERVGYLRAVVEKSEIDHSKFLIREGASAVMHRDRRTMYTTAKPVIHSVKGMQKKCNVTWTAQQYIPTPLSVNRSETPKCKCVGTFCSQESCECRAAGKRCSPHCSCVTNDCQNAANTDEVYDPKDISEENGVLSWYNPPALLCSQVRMHEDNEIRFEGSNAGEGFIWTSETDPRSEFHNSGFDDDMEMEDMPDFQEWEQQILDFDRFKQERTAKFVFLHGDEENAAIYFRVDDLKEDVNTIKQRLSDCARPLETVWESLRQYSIRHGYIEEYIHKCFLGNSAAAESIHSLKAMAAAAQLFKVLPDAALSLRVISRPLITSAWAMSQGRDVIAALRAIGGSESYIPNLTKHRKLAHEGTFLPSELTRQESFACIIAFETGAHDLRPQELESVMAICSGDSIYAAASLMCDPCIEPRPYELRKIVGNIGRAGIALLIPPQRPRMRQASLDNWNLIPHADYDGQDQDSFGGTSLHLWFTGYNETVPGSNTRGAQDIETFFLEAVVSVHDRGKWVADLDILTSLNNTKVHRATPCEQCSHRSARLPLQLTAIDSWEELLDPPKNSMIVRGHGNWMSRLAATIVSVQMDMETWILPPGDCWRHFIDQSCKGRYDMSTTFIR